ncbi:MAG TPA: septum formation initiator family protein [Thermoleophilaceae bacterium]|nr:septum formation initiator family protein [Thermoleophilaceae bacterium]
MASRAAHVPRRRYSSGRRGPIRWDRVGRVALLVVLAIILALYVSPAKHWIEQSGTAGAEREELGRLKSEQDRLESQVRDLRRPAALEREARKLGMVKGGERSYVIRGLPRD